VRLKSPLSRSRITHSAAGQVLDRNGQFAVSGAAGHTHSSRSRICCTWELASTISFPASTGMPQPAPGLVDRLGHVAAQLRGQPGNQHRVLVVGLVERQVLGPAAQAATTGCTHTNGIPRSCAS
jgi:hypothetical protein